MTGWIVLLAIFAALVLLSQIRLGGHAAYTAEGVSVVILAGPVRVRVFPPDPNKKQKKGKKREKPAAAEKHEKKQQGGTLGRLMELLPAVSEAAGALKRRIRVDHLNLTVIWGAEDAASAAIGYGRAYAALGIIVPLLENNFKVKKCDIRAEVDYGRTVPEVTADAAITMTLGQLISFVMVYGGKLLSNWSRSGKRLATKQEAECNE